MKNLGTTVKNNLPVSILILAVLASPLTHTLYVQFSLVILAIVVSSLIFRSKIWLLFPIAMLVGFVMEFLGVWTGFPFGRYRYEALQPQILGVAVAVPIAWGVFIFISYTAAHYVTKGFKADLLTACLMVVLDLAMDPLMVRFGAWVWITKTDPSWFGVPWTNFVGWFCVSLMAMLIYKKIVGQKEKFYTPVLAPTPFLLQMAVFSQFSDPPALYALVVGIAIVVPLWFLKITQACKKRKREE